MRKILWMTIFIGFFLTACSNIAEVPGKVTTSEPSNTSVGSFSYYHNKLNDQIQGELKQELEEDKYLNR